ncbi:hypothetical protein ACFE04_003189 [Oxalis oulophora]
MLTPFLTSPIDQLLDCLGGEYDHNELSSCEIQVKALLRSSRLADDTKNHHPLTTRVLLSIVGEGWVGDALVVAGEFVDDGVGGGGVGADGLSAEEEARRQPSEENLRGGVGADGFVDGIGGGGEVE